MNGYQQKKKVCDIKTWPDVAGLVAILLFFYGMAQIIFNMFKKAFDETD